jgi:hypothetical protein
LCSFKSIQNNLKLELDYNYIIDDGCDEEHYEKYIKNKIHYFKEENKMI